MRIWKSQTDLRFGKEDVVDDMKGGGDILLRATTLLGGQVWYSIVAWIGHHLKTGVVANSSGFTPGDRV